MLNVQNLRPRVSDAKAPEDPEFEQPASDDPEISEALEQLPAAQAAPKSQIRKPGRFSKFADRLNR